MIDDVIAPARPQLPVVSRVLFSHGRYTVSLVRAGVCVQDNAHGTGKIMGQNHEQYKQWASAWDDVIDTAEGVALCRAFLR